MVKPGPQERPTKANLGTQNTSSSQYSKLWPQYLMSKSFMSTVVFCTSHQLVTHCFAMEVHFCNLSSLLPNILDELSCSLKDC